METVGRNSGVRSDGLQPQHSGCSPTNKPYYKPHFDTYTESDIHTESGSLTSPGSQPNCQRYRLRR
jgi:hypothetical protein